MIRTGAQHSHHNQNYPALAAITKAVSTASLFIITALVLTGCGNRETVLKGEREAILVQAPELVAISDAQAEGAGLSQMIRNDSAGHPGLNSGHAGGHIEAELPFEEVWSVSVNGSDEDIVSLPQPVYADGRLYLLTGDAVVVALAGDTGAEVWTMAVDNGKRGVYPGRAGGLALVENMLAVHAARRDLAMLDANTGEIRWAVSHDAPLQAGPTFIGNEAVLVSDIEGQLYAYTADTGDLLWENAGLPVSTVIFGAAFPAVHEDMVVIAGSGGEMSVHQASDATLLWAETLASLSPKTPLEGLSDILAHPVHDGQNIVIAAQSGRIASFQADTGLLNWEQPISVAVMPWLAGQTVFAVSISGELYALRSSDGAVRWKISLKGAVDSSLKAGDDLPNYLSPFVASNQVHMLSEDGVLYSFDADTGAPQGSVSIGGDIRTQPQIADGAVFILSQSGNVTMLR